MLGVQVVAGSNPVVPTKGLRRIFPPEADIRVHEPQVTNDMNKARILITNDDGIYAPGIIALAEALEPAGEVTVVAPDRERSASSHAISLHRPLRVWEIAPHRFACDGTPTDSVYLGVNHIMAANKPDLVVSGINLGSNMADDVTYSGTLAGAFEGTILRVPSIAISLEGRSPWDFTVAKEFICSLASAVLARGLPPGVLLNVNVPPGKPEGYRVTKLGRRKYSEKIDVREDPRGGRYFWIGGPGKDHEDIPNSDCNTVIDDSLISVSPFHLDLTAHHAIDLIRNWKLDGFDAG